MKARTQVLAATGHAGLLALPVALTAALGGTAPSVSVYLTGTAVVVWGALEARWSVAAKSGFEARGVSSALPTIAGVALLAVVLAALLEPLLMDRHTPLWTTASGLVAFAVGVMLRRAAYLGLGPNYVHECAVRPAHELVQTGVFAHCRHPSELGVLLIAVGISAAAGSIGGLALALLVLAPVIVARTRTEDQLLAERFGAGFLRYRATTPALLPRVRRHRIVA